MQTHLLTVERLSLAHFALLTQGEYKTKANIHSLIEYWNRANIKSGTYKDWAKYFAFYSKSQCQGRIGENRKGTYFDMKWVIHSKLFFLSFFINK